VEAEPATGQSTAAQPESAEGTSSTRLRSAARIAALDVVGPLIAYALLRKAGLSAVTALILSGVLPAIGVTASAVQRRRLDIIGAVVIVGVVVGAVIGLISHNARLVLLEGSVPTAVFGLACLISLRARKPLLFGFAHEFVGPDSARGREMTRLWQFAAYRHAYRVVTAVWGVGYIVEAGVRVAIVENTSTGTALVASKFLPYVGAAILAAWTVAYARSQWRKA
jgi:intracellular septation protein A